MKFFLVLIIFFIPSALFACICNIPTVQENYNTSTWVLRVKVTEIKKIQKNKKLKKNGYTEVFFNIEEIFKSNGMKNSFSTGGHSCGFVAMPGWELIVFINSEGWVSGCSNSVENLTTDPESVIKFHNLLDQLRQLPNRVAGGL